MHSKLLLLISNLFAACPVTGPSGGRQKLSNHLFGEFDLEDDRSGPDPPDSQAVHLALGTNVSGMEIETSHLSCEVN
jgi:hypothetical protein